MLMILARLVRSESFWAVVKVRSPHTGPEVCYIIAPREAGWEAVGWARRRRPGRTAASRAWARPVCEFGPTRGAPHGTC